MRALVTVDTESLRRLAERIRQAVAPARVGPADPGSIQAVAGSPSSPVLARATGAFVDAWSATLAELVADADRLADAVDLVAASYQDAETLTDRGLLGGILG